MTEIGHKCCKSLQCLFVHVTSVHALDLEKGDVHYGAQLSVLASHQDLLAGLGRQGVVLFMVEDNHGYRLVT